MSWFRNYLIIGGRDAKLTETQRASGLQTVNIYDVKNKLVGARAPRRRGPLCCLRLRRADAPRRLPGPAAR